MYNTSLLYIVRTRGPHSLSRAVITETSAKSVGIIYIHVYDVPRHIIYREGWLDSRSGVIIAALIVPMRLRILCMHVRASRV